MKSTKALSTCYSGIIASIVEGCGFESYLELGIYDGCTINGVAEKCGALQHLYAVDIKNPIRRLHQKVQFIRSSTDAFFKENRLKFDCIFIDADHEFYQARKDFFSAIEVLNDDGVIFLHDTYPPSVEYAVPGYCGDVYKLYQELQSSGYEIINLPLYNGLAILRKCAKGCISTIK